MHPRFAFALLFSVCAFGLGIAIPAFPVQECGPNAEYKQCGSACVSDCSHPEPYTICTLQCVSGCFCKEGYLKNTNGECVRVEDCEAKTHHNIPIAIPMAMNTDPQCPDNEEFHPCGSACPATCANPNAPDQPCTRQCVIGCFCNAGMMRNSRGVCVRAEQCDAQTNMLFAYPPEVSQCKESEIFMPCGSACAPTCANPRPSAVCTKQCVVGCFCAPGYLKNEHGVCVPSVQCGVPAAEAFPMPPQGICKENEEYRQCKGCDGTCAKPNPICPRICIPGCACKQGHLRDGNGLCMPATQCPQVQVENFMALPPKKCGENEVFHACGTACPATCDNPNAPDQPCTRQCVIGCFCKEGFFKNAMGKCVTMQNCDGPVPHILAAEPEQKCSTDREMYVNDEIGATLDCMATCGTPLPFIIHGVPQVPKKCKEMPRKASCVCKKPYVRNSEGKCVERSQCEKTDMMMEAEPIQKCSTDREMYINDESGATMDCMATCGTPLPFMIHGKVQIPKKCKEMPKKPSCVCKRPYVRNSEGKCVERAECEKTNMMEAEPVQKCPTDREMYVNDEIGAALDCMATCGTPLPHMIHGEPQIPPKCKEMTRMAACVCKKPYVRNSEGRCVERSECDKTNPLTTPAH